MMPYIPIEARTKLDPTIQYLIEQLDSMTRLPEQAACTTYAIYKILRYLYGKSTWHNRAQAYLIIESVRSEFQRNCMDAYEDSKKLTNGDVG